MIAAARQRYGADAVAYTYNDPVIFAEYAIDTALACREQGIRNVAVTAGYIHPEPRREFFAVMDAANVDLKAFTDSSTTSSASPTCSRCSTSSPTSITKPTAGWKSPRC